MQTSNYYDCYNKINGRLLGTLYADAAIRSEDILGFSTLISQIERKLIKENIMTITLHASSSLNGLDARRRLGTTFKKLKAGKAPARHSTRRKRTTITAEIRAKVWDEHDRGFETAQLMKRNGISRASVKKILANEK